MTPDDLLNRESRAWMEKAAVDLRSAEALLRVKIPSSALFHCQQAAEKSFKAFLTWHKAPFRRVHDLEEIGGLCVSIDPTLAAVAKRAEPLSAYAWKVRYPGEPYEPEMSEAEEGMEIARLVLGEIGRRLPEAARVSEEHGG
jgi:HEPN domain-containing protein